jgi:hypothetical protein
LGILLLGEALAEDSKLTCSGILVVVVDIGRQLSAWYFDTTTDAKSTYRTLLDVLTVAILTWWPRCPDIAEA